MATQYSNKPIVTNGLVYALDFGNQKSYVSGSSSARSLLFNPLTASVSGSPTFTSTGLLNLSSSSNVLTNKTFSELTINNSYTVSTLVQVKSAGVFWNQDASPSSDAGYLNTTSTGVGHLVTDSAYLQGSDFRRGFNADLSQLTHITYRNYSGSFDVFINGVPVNTTGDYGGMLRGGGLNLSARDNNGAFWSGSTGNFYIYNRALTSDEIYSNYLLTAQRFGLRTTPKPYTVDENAYLFLSQSGITDPIITSSIDTFVRGLKANNLWGKMAVIYPFVGTGSVGVNLTGSHRINLKEPGINAFIYSGSWNGSVSGSTPSGSGTYIDTGVNPQSRFPNYVANNYHMSILSYDTPVSSSALMGTGMTKDLAVSTLAGDYGTPAAAYSVRKVRTAYSGALMDVRRSIDNVTQSIGYVTNGDLDTGSLLDFVVAGRATLPGAYSGLAAAYSLRKVSGSYTGSAIDVRRDSDNTTGSIGFDASGNLDTGSLLTFLSASVVLPGAYSGVRAAYSLRKVVSTYTGSVIMIQSGSVSQSIGFTVTGDLDTGSIATFAGSGDAFVRIWYDQSGNNNHASQSTALNQPKIYSGSLGSVLSINGKPALSFNGANALNMSNLHGQTLLDQYFVASTADITYLYPHAEGYGFVGASGSTDTGLSGAYGSPNLYSNGELFTGSNRGQVYNSLSGSKVIVHQGANTSVWTYYRFGDYGGYEFTGYLQELIAYTSSQASNRKSIENNINTYYNVYARPSGYVAQWYDQSGNNRHATQTATGSQPLIVSSGSLVTEGTKPAVKFYTNLGMDTGFTGLVTKSLFIAASTEAGLNINDNGRRLFSSYTGGGGVAAELLLDGQGTGSFRYIDGGATLSVLQSASYQLTTAIRNSTLNLAFNGGSITSGGSPNSSPNTLNYRIGEDAGLSSIETAKSIQEVILYNNDQSSNRTLIENNINNYYSIYTSSAAGYVAKWYDQSGNNRHATQTATGSQPVIVLSGSIITENTRSALSFDGIGMFFNLSSNITATSPFSSFAVGRRSSNGTNMFFYGGSGVTHGLGSDNKYYLQKSTGYLQSNNTDTTNQQILLSGIATAATQSQFKNSTEIASTLIAAGIATTVSKLGYYVDASPFYFTGKYQELSLYLTDQTSNREAVEYGINNYYNIYPQTSSFATSSFTIYATTSSISASINNDIQSGISSSGPLGFITVSRTGSNSLTIAKNGVTSSFTVPASGALSTGIYLGAVNNNGIAVGSSPYNISFASVGVGLSNSELLTYKNLVNTLQTSLGRFDLDALSFISSTQTLNITQQNAINTLVLDLKGFSLWDKMKAIYPFIGGTANTHKFNLKDPRDLDVAYRLTFSGTWTHNISGSQPTDSRADSYIVPPTDLERDSVHLSIYSQTSAVTSGADWAAQMNTFYFGPLLAASLYATINNGESNTGGTPYSSARGLLIATRVNSNTVNFYYNTNLLRTSTVNSAAGSSTQTLLLGGFVDGRYNSNKMWSFGTVGSGLSTVDVNNLYTAVQKFQTTLGRQV